MPETKIKLNFEIMDLSEAAGYSYDQLRPFRENRFDALQEYVGKHYSDNGSDDRVPIPLLELAVNIYMQSLVANNPRVMIETGQPKLRELVERFKIALNHLISKEIDLEDTLSKGTKSALFTLGIVKVGLNATQVEYLGSLFDSGQPYAEFVSLDNWVHDMTSDDFRQCQFMADRYTMTKVHAQEIFNKNKDGITAQADLFYTEETAHQITDENTPGRKEFKERAAVWDIWLPEEKQVVTVLDTGDPYDPFGEVLAVVDWYGVETGPYHILGFEDVESNTMPLSPVSQWRDLHELANKLFRKLGRQAERQKTFTAVSPQNLKDGERVVDVNDGEVIPIDNPDKLKEVKAGGIAPENLAFLLQVKDLFSYMAGNLDLLGGLAPQSDTVGQDTLLSAGASKRMQRMKNSVYKWTAGICKALGFYLYTDPLIDMPVVKRIPGLDDISVTERFGPDDERNEADFCEYNMTIEPYSLQNQSPEQKLIALRTIFGEMIMPLLPQMAQAGIILDFEQWFRTIGELGNVPELNKILIYTDPKHQPPMVGQPPGQPANTKRTYERISRPGASRQGKDQIMAENLLGNKQQPSQTASLFRPTG